MNVSSSRDAARDGISGFMKIDAGRAASAHRTTVGSSTIASVHAGATAADRVLDDLASLAASVKEQSAKVTALAAIIEDRDAQDAGTLSRES